MRKMKPDWQDDKLEQWGFKDRGMFTFVRTWKPSRIIGKFFLNMLGMQDLKIGFEFPRGVVRWLKTLENKDMICLEIGTRDGKNALSMLKNLSIKKLYLIDPYIFYEGNLESNSADETSYNNAKELLKDYEDKVVFIKKKSSDAVNDIPDNLDFIYIDGNHTYNYVKEDIENYWKKLKVNGIMAGHDFHYKEEGVIKAVLEFVFRNKLKLYNHPYSFGNDWWIVK